MTDRKAIARERLAKDCRDTGVDHATHRKFFKRQDHEVMADIETLLTPSVGQTVVGEDVIERAFEEAAKLCEMMAAKAKESHDKTEPLSESNKKFRTQTFAQAFILGVAASSIRALAAAPVPSAGEDVGRRPYVEIERDAMKKTILRIWNVLGNPEYETLKGKDIVQIIEERLATPSPANAVSSPERNAALEEAAKIADKQIDAARNVREAKNLNYSEGALVEIWAEERGENIASEIIAKQIRAALVLRKE